MPEIQNLKLSRRSVFKRQFAVCIVFAVLLAVIVASLYVQNRRREWTLRKEQARHRLDVAFELISRELEQVRADVLFLADQMQARQFVQGDESYREPIQTEYRNFIRRKQRYDQIRLLDLQGRETIRVNYTAQGAVAVIDSELQDKSDRYYFRDAISLQPDDVLVSEFDLNLEYGRLERPLKPVIRFVTPVVDEQQITRGFVVLNYLGARLLQDLGNPALPGFTMLLRGDGNYLRSPNFEDNWGWLLGHDRTFAAQFPDEWSRIDAIEGCELTPRGAFAAKRVPLRTKQSQTEDRPREADGRNSLVAVSYLPRDQVFADSHRLLKRLLLLSGSIFIPVAVLTRFWALAMTSRQLQHRQLEISEERLRELSSRLLRIQEDERRAISREIHDELGQQATAINLDLKLAARNIASEPARTQVERAIRENEQLLRTLHEFATRVRPAVLDDLGLRDAIESHLWEFQQRTGVEVLSDLSFDSAAVPSEIADNAYRLLQESLNNVAKHADASTVRVNVAVETSHAKSFLVLSIRDDGRGYVASNKNASRNKNAPRRGRRLGLLGMQERVDLLSGELHLESDIEKGTGLEFRLPFDVVDHPEPSRDRSESSS